MLLLVVLYMFLLDFLMCFLFGVCCILLYVRMLTLKLFLFVVQCGRDMFKFLRTTETDQNLIQEEIKKRLNSGNACYHSDQKLLSSRLLSKNVNIKIFKTLILTVILYGCEI
jgi:hypothetical protein